MVMRVNILRLLLPSICYILLCNPHLISEEQIIENHKLVVSDAPISEDAKASKDAYIHALASLIFYLHQELKTLEECSHSFGTIEFTDADLSNLWNKVSEGISTYPRKKKRSLFLKAHEFYTIANQEVQNGLTPEAQKSLEKAESLLKGLLEKAIEEEERSAHENDNLNNLKPVGLINDPVVKNHPYMPKKVKQAIKPYLLSHTHPMRNIMDEIFRSNRPTENKEIFSKAGFQIIAAGSRSHILVAKHEKLPGYLIKTYLDTELNKKHDRESWEWLVRRCQGAKQIREIIKRRNIQFFAVPDKWLYCLPPEPTPLDNPFLIRHFAILLVTDMQLAPQKRNYNAWYHDITKEHLNELYAIITRAKGSSYRPDNIAYTKNNQFAFIDTEYPTRGPDYLSIRFFLNSDMCSYWDRLVTNGGF